MVWCVCNLSVTEEVLSQRQILPVHLKHSIPLPKASSPQHSHHALLVTLNFIRHILRVSVLLLPLANKWDLPCFASSATLHAVLGTKHALWECLSHEFNPSAKYLSAASPILAHIQCGSCPRLGQDLYLAPLVSLVLMDC